MRPLIVAIVITSTLACSRANTPGQSGEGLIGENITVTALPAGDGNCPEGGVRLDGAEGSLFVCNGLPGTLGLQGPTGAPGLNGNDGAPGRDGAPGAQGLPGAQGIQGIQGLRGAQGERGLQGLQGVQGTPGTNGTNGRDGAPGVLARRTHSWSIPTSLTGNKFVPIRGSELDVEFSGQAVLVFWDITLSWSTSVLGRATCRPTVNGTWAALFDGSVVPSTYGEGMITTNIGTQSQLWSKTRLYLKLPSGGHQLAVECLVDNQDKEGTFVACPEGTSCSLGYLELGS